MKPVVFLGPTLPRDEALQLLNAEYLPPVRQGSLEQLTTGCLVAIIDGELSPGATLPDSEIRDASRRGLVLYGAASVGAYHASRFIVPNMRGVGWVYEQYRANRISSFNEISVLYHPVSLQALSVPLVNVRFWLNQFVNASIITSADAFSAMKQACQLDLNNRDFSGIKACLLRHLRHELVQKELCAISAFPDIKGDDARALLRLCARIIKNDASGDPEPATLAASILRSRALDAAGFKTKLTS